MIERAGLTLDGEVTLSIAADEETGGTLGTGHLAREGLLAGADAARARTASRTAAR